MRISVLVPLSPDMTRCCSSVTWVVVALLASILCACAAPAPVVAPPPRSTAEKVRRLVALAEAEWRRWGSQMVRSGDDGKLCALLDGGRCEPVEDGCGREQSSAYCSIVEDYWRPIREITGRRFAHDCSVLDVCQATLPPDAEPVPTPAWSAAFIGKLMRDAGFGVNEFRISAFHAEYVVAAREGHTSAYAVVPTPALAAAGDLVCATRFAQAPQWGPGEIDRLRAEIEDRDITPMHCDIVVGIDREVNEARTIGGNVMQSVSLRHVALDEAGRIPATSGIAPGWMLVMRARTPP